MIAAELVQRWEHQMTIDYAALSEEEKASDRDQVDGYLPVIAARLDKLD